MSTSLLSKEDYDVLNAVALKKMASAAAVAAVCRRDEEAAHQALHRLAGTGLLFVVDGSALPGDGAEPALAAAAAEHYAAVRTDPAVLDQVARFETVNSQFLAAMSAWQQVDVGGQKVPNDHTDSAYDDRIISRLDRLVARIGPLIDALAGHDPRFAGYRERFEQALAGIDAGRHDLVSSPTVDSVHNIWFEFHEDLLRTLGREREE